MITAQSIEQNLKTKNITGVLLKDNTYFQMCDDYVGIYNDGYAVKMYVGRNPTVLVKPDIWGGLYLGIGHDGIKIHPSQIEEIDYEDKETPED